MKKLRQTVRYATNIDMRDNVDIWLKNNIIYEYIYIFIYLYYVFLINNILRTILIMGSVATSLMRGRWACDYIHNTVCFRITNHDDGVNMTNEHFNFLPQQVKQTRIHLKSELLRISSTREQIGLPMISPLVTIPYQARILNQTRAGRCGEAAVLAFDYLMDKGERGMAVMSIIGCDHAFIILGLQANPSVISHGVMCEGPPKAWGKNTVVCDPWYNECFLSDVDWMRKIRQIVRYATRNTDEITGEVTGLDLRDTADISLKRQYYI